MTIDLCWLQRSIPCFCCLEQDIGLHVSGVVVSAPSFRRCCIKTVTLHCTVGSFVTLWKRAKNAHRAKPAVASCVIIIIIRHAPYQCVAPLATNSLHSDLSKASSIASSKVRLCRDRGAQLACSNRSDEHQSESSWRRLSRPFWPGGQTTWVFVSVWYVAWPR